MEQASGSVAQSTNVPRRRVRFTRKPVDALAAELDAAREPVLASLRTAFPAADHEDLYQEACATLLELVAGGTDVGNVQALLKTIAWRRAADSTRRKRPDSLDALPLVAESFADDALAPDEAAQLRLDGDALRLIVESLDERQAAVLKLKFDQGLSAREVQERLGLSAKRLEKIVGEAYKQIAGELAPAASPAESRWRRRQRSLLLACEVGIASPRQRLRAKDMLARDASCRAMLAEMRAALHDVAAVLPVPVIAEHCDRAGVLGRLDEAWLSIRHLVETVTGRAASSGAVEQAGVGGATLSAGAAAKVATACLFVGGAATFCLGGGNEPLKAPPQAQAESPSPKPTQRKQIERKPIVRVVMSKARTVTKPKRSTATPRVPVSSPASTAPASPAPAGSSEFGPGAVGSTPPSRQPAAAPQDGGGEFGP